MRYLVYARPGASIESRARILREQVGLEPYSHPSLPMHCTLALWNTDRANEDRLVKALDAMWCMPVKSAVSGAEVFDGGALVLTLEKTASMEHLHFAVLDALREAPLDAPLDDPDLAPDARAARRMYGSEYFGSAYRPHVTIGRMNGTKVEMDSIVAPGLRMRASEVCLARRDPDGWSYVTSFGLDGSLFSCE